MAYREPGNTVTQVYGNAAVASTLPQLAPCIIGPVYQMKDEASAGSYDGTLGTDQSFAFPDLLAGSVVDIRKSDVVVDDELPYPVEVLLKDAQIALYEPSSGAWNNGNITANSNTLTVSTSAFTFNLLTAHYVRLNYGTYRHDLGSAAFDLIHDGGVDGHIDLVQPLAYVNDFRAGNPTSLHVVVGGIGIDYLITSVDPALNRINITGIAANAITDAGTATYVFQAAPGNLEANESGIRRVTAIVDVNNIRVVGIPYNVSYTDLSFDVVEVKDITINRDHFEEVLPSPITIDETGVTIPVDAITGIVAPDFTGSIESASVYLTFRALRTPKAVELTEITGVEDLETVLGTLHMANTGVWAVYKALLNAGNKSVYIVGVDEDFFSDVSVTRVAAFATALEQIEQKLVYALAVCSMDPAVHQVMNAHVDAMSDPEICKWRVAHLAHKLVTTTDQSDGTTGNGFVGPRYEGINPLNLDSLNGTFLTDGVAAEDRVVINSFTREPQLVTTVTPVGAPIQVIQESRASSGRTVIRLVASVHDYSGLVGKNVKFSVVGGTMIATSADLDLYKDADHPIGLTGYNYATMGYRCIAAAIDGADTLLIFEFVSNGFWTALPLVPGTANFSECQAWDSILSKSLEDALLSEEGHEVTSVENENSLTLVSAAFPATFTGRFTNVNYNILRPMTKTEQAEYMAAYARSYNDRRIRFEWPDVYEEDDGTEMYGYFIAAAHCGWISNNPPQQGMTDSTMAGFYRLTHTNKYFTKISEMNALAEGGVCIFTQEVDGANVLCRHQLSSNMDTIYYQEQSITHSVDTASYLYLNALNGLKGKNNITADLFSALATRFEGVKSNLVENPLPGIGAVLKDVSLLGTGQSSSNIDRVYAKIRCVPNVPCNGIDVTLYIQ